RRRPAARLEISSEARERSTLQGLRSVPRVFPRRHRSRRRRVTSNRLDRSRSQAAPTKRTGSQGRCAQTHQSWRHVARSGTGRSVSPLDADHQFFAALIKADVPVLERVLSADFILIDVMSGSEISKSGFLGFVRSGQIKFESVAPTENRVRIYHRTAVITGRTEMEGKLGDTPFVAHSRYTHVYAMQQTEWRLVSAQGTQITPPPEA